MKEKLKQIKPIQKMMVLALLVLLLILTTQPTALAQPLCQTLCDGKVPTIVGTEGSEVINGTEGPDVIHGLGGNDLIHGLGGDDLICGGEGQDVIGSGDGNDIVLGENGHDSIWGGPGDDILRGGDGNDTIVGGSSGNDTLYGNQGNDSLYGKSGDDKLYGGWGTENNDSCYDDPGTFIWGCEQFNGEFIPPAPVPRTGQTRSWAHGDDGDLQMGVQWPDPRFTDNGDGTVTDHLTGLIWLKNANCFGEQNWWDALDVSNNLADGQCGLTDGSSPGDWRLPNVKELHSLSDYAYRGPPPPPGPPFTDVQNSRHWTSTTYPFDRLYPGQHAWHATPGGHIGIYSFEGKRNKFTVWPVRGGD